MMADLPISLLPYVGNTGYTNNDLLVFVNYTIPSGTTSNTTLIQHKNWILSGISDYYVTAFTYNNNTFTISDNSGNTFNATINTVTGLTVDGNLIVTGTSNFNIVTASTISNVNYIDFNLTASPTHNEGRIHWNDDQKTLDIDTDVNNFEIEVGHMNVVRVVNKTLTTLNKGELVWIDGAQGGRPTVTRADYSGDSTSARTLGFIGSDISNNNNGYVITYGLLRDVNTLAYSSGTQLYLFTGGTWTNVRPIAPKHEVRVGVVVEQNATTGIIFVNVMNGYELTELHDVSATTVNNFDVLQWNSLQNVWQPTNAPSFNSISATTYFNLPIGIYVTGSGVNSTVRESSNNSSSGDYAATLGGCSSSSQGSFGFIGNGVCNNICNSSLSSLAFGGVVVGGVGNNTTGGTWNSSTCSFTSSPTICNSGQYSFIGNGFQNLSKSSFGAVVNGCSNVVDNCNSFIGNGTDNQIYGASSFIGAGGNNKILFTVCACGEPTPYSNFIGAGCQNTINGSNFHSVIVGGYGNTIAGVDRYDIFIGAGDCNTASHAKAAIVGGCANLASACITFVGGGHANSATAIGSSVIGGEANTASGCYSSAVGSGVTNSCDFSFMSNLLRACNIFGAGSICANAGGTIVPVTSDFRQKECITEIPNNLEKIMNLRPVSFYWNNTYSKLNGNQKQYGFVAQEVKEILPEAVYETSEGYYGIDLFKIIPHLVKSIQELKKEIDEIKK